MTNIVEIIRQETRSHQAQWAIIEGKDRVTYADLFRGIDQVAGALRCLGVQPLDRVGILCEDGIDYVLACLSALSLSSVVVPVPVASPHPERMDLLDKMDVQHLLFADGLWPGDQGQLLSSQGFVNKTFRLLSRSCRNDLPAAYAEMNPAFIRFSSGTTGTSKGVLLSHETIVDRTSAADKGLRVTSEDKVISLLSMSFHFVASILLFLRRGATIIVVGAKEFPGGFMEILSESGGSLIYASPFHYHTLASSPSIPPEALSKVRLAITTAMRLPEGIQEAFQTKFGWGLSSAYGIIEVGLPFMDTGLDLRRPGSVGRILPDHEVRIDHPNEEGLGDILLRGAGFFDAYVSPWRPRSEVMQDGWFHTGDVGRLDEQGFLFIQGRTSDVINFAGMKVFPYEVEEVLNQHPAVQESLVFGVPHPQYGALPQARVVLREGAAFDLQDLRRFCFARLASYKVPKEFQIVPQLERTASDKVRRVRAGTSIPG